MQLYHQPIYTAATTGWFDTSATTTNINLNPVYVPQYVQPVAPDPVPSKPESPLDWLRGRVGECVAAGTL